MSERLPTPDGARIAAAAPNKSELVVVPTGTTVLRVHPLGGSHPYAWNQLRSWGPTGSRFDHQPRPPRDHPTRSIMYVTTGQDAFPTALAEFFQDAAGRVGPIDRVARTPAVTAFSLTSPLHVLDLDSGWVTKAGGNQAITSGHRGRARAWARAIYRHHPDVQGLRYRSSVYGPGVCVAVWERGALAMPAGNDLHRVLSDPAMDDVVAEAADRLGTIVVP